MSRLVKALIGFYLVGFIGESLGYSAGPPPGKKFVCDQMKPSAKTHGEPQPQPIPYSLKSLKGENSVEIGKKIYLSLEAPEGEFYKGFMIQARDDQGNVRGEFENKPGAKIVDCEGSKGSVGHENAENKSNVTIVWKATSDTTVDETVTFYATVLKDLRTFWTDENMISVKIAEGDPNAEPEGESEAEGEAEGESEAESEAEGESYAEGEAEGESEGEPEGESEGEPESSSNKQKDPIYEGCEESKGCFGVPASCVKDSSCKVLTSYFPTSDNKFRLVLHGEDNPNRYLAFAISEDGAMGDDFVISCRNIGSKPIVKFGWNFGHSQSSDLEKDIPKISNVELTKKNNGLTCSFDIEPEMKISVPGSDDETVSYDLSKNDYHILVAEGPATESKLSYHAGSKTSSSEPVSLRSFAPIGEKSDVLIKVHGVLMVISWMIFSFVGILLARFYKQTWKGTKVLGTPIWFISHRTLMASAVLLTTVAFIIIMIEIGGWNYSAEFIRTNPHPALGIATFILCLIQPIMALKRPHPGTDNRWIFNWAHWSIGNCAQILGIAAIFFSVELSKAKLPTETTFIVAAFVIVSFLAHLILSCQLVYLEMNPSSNEVGPSHSRKSYDFEEEREDRDDGFSVFRKMLLGVYILLNLAFSGVIIGLIIAAPGEF